MGKRRRVTICTYVGTGGWAEEDGDDMYVCMYVCLCMYVCTANPMFKALAGIDAIANKDVADITADDVSTYLPI